MDTLFILYVDDEPALLDIGKLFLEESGEFSVDILPSAQSALAVLDSKKYDAIISDYQMPKMNGIEFLKQIRASGSSIPFIIFTGRGREEVVIQALNEGVDFYLQKGGDPESQFAELSNKIHYAVMRRRAEEALKLEREGLLKKNEELNASYEQIAATEEELRSNFDDMARQGQALRDSEERYRNVVEDQTEFICRFLPDGTHIFVNEAYCRYFTVKRDEILGHRFRPKIPVEDQERIKRFFASLTPDHPVDVVEHRIIMADGALRWQRWSDRAIFSKDGHIREYQSVGRDITDRKEAEEKLQASYEQLTASEEELRHQFDELKKSEDALRESEQKLQGIVLGSPIPQFVIDKNHLIVSWNRALEEYSRVNAKEVVGTTHAWKAFYDEQRSVLANLLVDNKPETIQELYAGKFRKSKYVDGAYEVIDFFPRMGGHGVWLYFTAAVLRDYKGNIVGAVETLEDITDRKEAEQRLQVSHEQITASEEELRHQFDELKKSEDALRASDERYRTVFETTGTATVLIESDATISLVNYEFERLSGYHKAEIENKKKWTEFVVKEDLDRMLAQHRMRRTDQNNALTNYEFRFVSRSGEVHDIYLTNKVIPGTATSVASLLDITERKKMEDRLVAANSEYTSLLNQIQDMYYRSDTEGRLIKASRSWTTLLGYDDISECLGRNIADDFYFNPADRKSFIEEVYRNGKVTDYEVRLRRKDGSPVVVATSSHLYYDSAGNILGIEGTFHDITVHKLAEERLSEVNLAFLAFTPDPLHNINILTGLAGKMLRGSCALYNRLEGGLLCSLGMWNTPPDFVSCDQPEGHICNDVILNGGISPTIITNLPVSSYADTDPNVRQYQLKTYIGIPVKIGGKFLGSLCVVYQDTYLPSSQDLETLSFLAKAVSVEDERRIIEKALRLANKKLTFLSSITRHDIMNQLTVLRSYLELSKELEKDPVLAGFIAKEATAAEAIEKQIRFTQYYENIGMNAPQWKNIARLIQSSVSQLNLGSIILSVTLSEVVVYADPMIEKVFYNLIENSLRHGGHVTRIGISFSESDEGGLLVYEDDGTGIAADSRNQLFARGFGKHTGLGLFLSREILAITGITIRETGEPGKGARFEIMMPKGAYRSEGRP